MRYLVLIMLGFVPGFGLGVIAARQDQKVSETTEQCFQRCDHEQRVEGRIECYLDCK